MAIQQLRQEDPRGNEAGLWGHCPLVKLRSLRDSRRQPILADIFAARSPFPPSLLGFGSFVVVAALAFQANKLDGGAGRGARARARLPRLLLHRRCEMNVGGGSDIRNRGCVTTPWQVPERTLAPLGARARAGKRAKIAPILHEARPSVPWTPSLDGITLYTNRCRARS